MMRAVLATMLLSVLLATSSLAEQLIFVWAYSSPAEIDGFRLYRDGQTLDTDNIPPTATTITVARQNDKQNHSYHLVAFSGTEESGPSQTALDVYSYTIKTVGAFTIEVIK